MAVNTAGALLPAGADAPVRLRAVATDAWVLLARPGAAVRINGRRVGVRVLRERDEIVVGAARAFFSTERLAQVEAFPGGSAAIFCPRCKQEIAHGSLAVRCPGCGSWYHQREELGCWLYSQRCQHCAQATPLDGGFRWEPEF
jgi:hypothetical protein